jgi:HPt (histidine-containing phosphotransfer) domain-containing protein
MLRQNYGLNMAPFNQTEFLIEIRGDLKLLASMAKLFIETADEALSEIESSLGDPKKLYRAIHQYRGSLGAVHANAAYNLASRLEQAVLSEDLASARDLLPALREETARLVEALQPLSIWPPASPQ